jgi:hypothetical protein
MSDPSSVKPQSDAPSNQKQSEGSVIVYAVEIQAQQLNKSKNWPPEADCLWLRSTRGLIGRFQTKKDADAYSESLGEQTIHNYLTLVRLNEYLIHKWSFETEENQQCPGTALDLPRSTYPATARRIVDFLLLFTKREPLHVYSSLSFVAVLS